MAAAGTFHRFEDDYLTADEWGDVLNVDARIALALGTEPIEDARHLLAPVRAPEAPPMPPAGPNPAVAFVLDLTPQAGAIAPGDARALLAPDIRASFDFPQAWAEAPARPGAAPAWLPLDELPGDGTARVSRLALAWPLGDLLSTGPEAEADLRRYVRDAGALAVSAGLALQAREGPAEAAARAARLLTLRRRFGRSVEMRLLPAGKPLRSRDIWRAAYGLGLTWGDLDLFHWRDSGTGRRLFTVSGLGQPGYFLPERAAEGEGVAGLALGFELPLSPAPLEVYDRMAVALAYLRQKLGGRPVAADGGELDADRLYTDRDALEEAVREMARAGIAAGSPEAARFF